MNKSITQATQNDKQISKSIKRFFNRFHISSALKSANAYKKKGISVAEVFQYLFLLVFQTEEGRIPYYYFGSFNMQGYGCNLIKYIQRNMQ